MIEAGACVQWGDWFFLRNGWWLQLRFGWFTRCTIDSLGYGSIYLESENERLCIFADGCELRDQRPPVRFSDTSVGVPFLDEKAGEWKHWQYSWSKERLRLTHLDSVVSLEFEPYQAEMRLQHKALGERKWPGAIARKVKPPSFVAPPKPSPPPPEPQNVVTPAPAIPSPDNLLELKASSARGTLVLDLPDALEQEDLHLLEFLLGQGKTHVAVLKERFGRRVSGRLANLLLRFQDAGKENLQYIEPECYYLEPDRVLGGR